MKVIQNRQSAGKILAVSHCTLVDITHTTY